MTTKSKAKKVASLPQPGAGIPTLENLLGSILDRLPPDAVKSIAGMPPLDEAERETFEGQVVELAQALAVDRVCGVEHVPNAATRRAIRDARAGKDVTEYASLADALADLGI
ncbi:hypothetical protein [Paludisphaera sp.]|uniref:hypothetical protein n=1 Tax=Paludisphaera sp. TaxID=2017432 RepID=UPI00301C0147